MIEAAKEEMLSGFGPSCADLPLAASLELVENSRLRFGSKKAALHLGQEVCNSTTALGIERGLLQNCIGSRIQTWNRYAYVANNPLISVDPKGLSIEGLLGDLFHKDNLTFQDCTVDGLSSPCSMAMMIAASPALQSLSYSCDGFGCGQISVDPDTGNYQTVVGWKSANIYSGRDENGDAMFNEGLAPSWEDIPDPTIAGGPQTMAASIGPGGKHFSRKRYSRGRNFRKAAAAIYS